MNNVLVFGPRAEVKELDPTRTQQKEYQKKQKMEQEKRRKHNEQIIRTLRKSANDTSK